MVTMTPRHANWSAPIVLIALTLLEVGCGARTAPGEEARDTGTDLGTDTRVDVGRDTSVEMDATDAMDADEPDAIITTPDTGVEIDAEACGGDCDDELFCTGEEICTADGCVSINPPNCDDLDECTVDSCNERRERCDHVEVDRDEDGDGVTSCRGDCDDRDPDTFPGAPEVCDLQDDDCDGRMDEGVRNECGDCRPDCNVVTVPGRTGWDLERDASGVEVAGDGDLRLSTSRTETNFGWISNTRFGTVTKLDLRTGLQVAEYDSVFVTDDNSPQPPGEQCLTDFRGGNCPSRTAVDLRGAVYIANRAFQSQGTVTKVAGREEDCVDRNRNGRIDTSQDRNGNGVIERDVRGEFVGQDDECLLWTVDVGRVGSTPRAIAVDARGFIWVGLYSERRVLKLDPSDGEILDLVLLPRMQPYGAAISGDGTLWIADALSGRIQSINTETSEPGSIETVNTREDCEASYGIAIDTEDRVWLAGFSCEAAFRYDPRTDRWFAVSLPDSGGTRGIAADDRGYIYVSASHTFFSFDPGGPIGAGDEITRVTRFRGEDGGDMTIFGSLEDPIAGRGAVGVGLDSNRNIWMVNQLSATVTRVNGRTGTATSFPVGEQPYTYSDFTGYALRTFTAPNGYVREIVAACPDGRTEWERLTVSSTTPADTRIEVRVRAADRVDQLPDAPWFGPFDGSPVDLMDVPAGVFLEVEAMLVSSERGTSPRLRRMTVQYNCP